MRISSVELKRFTEYNGVAKTCNLIEQSINDGKMSPNDFSLKGLAIAFCGEEWYTSLDPRGEQAVQLLEAGSGVDSTAFSNITGQIVYNAVLQGYQDEGFVFTPMVQNIPTKLSGEKIAGMGPIEGDGDIVNEGMPFPEYGFHEDYVETPETVKRGFIVSVTKEAIFFDRIAMVTRNASQVGKRLGYNKERRIIDLIIGATNNYKRKGTSVNTYLTSGDWINDQTGNTLEDYTDIDAALQLFRNMRDPYNSEPIEITPKDMIVMPQLLFKAKNIASTTEIRTTSNTNTQSLHANPLTPYNIVTSNLLYDREVVKGGSNIPTRWYLGDIRESFAYMENWPIQVKQAATNSDASFEQDIVARYRADERGAAAVLEPRKMTRNST